MKRKKVCNLYAGPGGNRTLWKNVNVTAIENKKDIAAIYQSRFPKDKVIVCDAHKYLKENFHRFDFIWSSVPCQSHSSVRAANKKAKPVYPDMKLYEEIIFLRENCKVPWVVENVVSYYPPLIYPYKVHRHYFWSNFVIPNIKLGSDNIEESNISKLEKIKGFSLKEYKGRKRKDQILRNAMNPKLGQHVFKFAFKEKQTQLI